MRITPDGNFILAQIAYKRKAAKFKSGSLTIFGRMDLQLNHIHATFNKGRQFRSGQ